MDKEEIRERNDIVDVVGAFVTIKKRGRNWIGLCPFHQEKTPSFNVDSTTQTFKCFGCGVGGDVFSFVERYQNMTFVEAAEFLARRVGGTLDRKGGEAAAAQLGERERIYELNALAMRWFRAMLDRVAVAQDYLAGRGVVHDTRQRFQLGYAPNSWEALTDYLRAQKQDLSLAASAGLIVSRQNREGDAGPEGLAPPSRAGDYFDMFRHRIIFPILDEQERVVGFGGRAFGDDTPKYLNTGETPVFNKSKLLYGLPFARRKIATESKTFLMEGYMDVIAAHQSGFTNAVATLGTSLTEDHARKLARLAPTVVLVYDSDSAGIKATLRASEILEKEGVQVRVTRLPEGDDPDSLLKRGETALLQRAIDEAAGRVEYQLERIIAESDQDTEGGRAQMLKKILYVLATVQTRAERDIYIGKVWRFHPMSAHGPSVATEQMHRDAEAVAASRKGERRRAQPAPTPPDGRGVWAGRSDGSTGRGYGPSRRRMDLQAPPPPPSGGPTAESELIRALAEPEWRESVLKHLQADDLPTEVGRRFYGFVAAHLDELKREDAELVGLLERYEEHDFSVAVRQRLQEIHALMAKVPLSEALVAGCARTLKEYRIQQVKQERARLLQSKPVLTEDDRERVREYERLLRELKGSAPHSRPDGSQGE